MKKSIKTKSSNKKITNNRAITIRTRTIALLVAFVFVTAGVIGVIRSYAATPRTIAVVGDSGIAYSATAIKNTGISNVDGIPGSRILGYFWGIPDGVSSGRIYKASRTYRIDTVVISLGGNEILFALDNDTHLREAITRAHGVVEQKDCIAWIVYNFVKKPSVSQEEHDRRIRGVANVKRMADQIASETRATGKKVRVYQWLPVESDYQDDGIHPNEAGQIKFAKFLLNAGLHCSDPVDVPLK